MVSLLLTAIVSIAVWEAFLKKKVVEKFPKLLGPRK